MSEQNNPNMEAEPLFSKEEYEKFKSYGLSQEDIEILEQAEAVCQVADVLPDDPTEVFNKIEALPNDPGQALQALNNMAEADPEGFAQIMAAVEAIDQINPTEE